MFNEIYKNKKVLITGNTGFKGSWLTVWMLSLEAEVFGLSKDIPTKPSLFEELQLDKKIKHYQADINDLSAMKRIILAKVLMPLLVTTAMVRLFTTIPTRIIRQK